MSGHRVSWLIEKDWIEPTFECLEPDDADCRTECREPACEGGCVDPNHPRHPVNYCNPIEWITSASSELECYAGPVHAPSDGPVEFIWTGDYYTWRYAKDDTP